MQRFKRGFTLVEVIVVLVIIAIIVALAVPAIFKYVDEANDTRYLNEGRSVLIALHTEAVEYKANGELSDTILMEHKDEILEKADVDGQLIEVTTTDAGNLITDFVYKVNGVNKYVIYTHSPERMYIANEYQTTSFGNSETMDEILSIIGTSAKYDSMAAQLSEDSNAAKIVESLKEMGIDLEAMGANSWSINNGNKNTRYIIWSDIDLSSDEYQVGDSVKVMRYNFTGDYAGLYSVWDATIREGYSEAAGIKFKELHISSTEYTSSLTREEKLDYDTVYQEFIKE